MGEGYEVLSLPLRLVLKATKSEAGDFRDRETIHVQAAGPHPALEGQGNDR